MVQGRGAFGNVQAQVGFALPGIEAVAGKARIGQNGPNVPVKQDMPFAGLSRRGKASRACDGSQTQAKQK